MKDIYKIDARNVYVWRIKKSINSTSLLKQDCFNLERFQFSFQCNLKRKSFYINKNILK